MELAGDMQAKILVAAHAPCWTPADPIYLPVQVGAVGKRTIPGFQRDDEGESISEQNPRYCELTALYWAWKNLPADEARYLGLSHYRRYFRGNGVRRVMTSADLAGLLAKAPVVLPAKRHYVIDSIEKHYGNTFDPVHIECLRAAIEAVQPAYLDAFNAHMAATAGHMFNMMVMRRDLADAYCAWLFEVLHLAEYGVDFEGLTPFQERAMGRLGERLLDTWIDANGISYAECPVVFTEKVDWARKGTAFLGAHFLGKKYEKSF